MVAYTYVQVTSGLAVMGLGVSNPRAPSPSLSAMARRSLQLGVGALLQSRGWLPIVEAPGYSRHPTSILAMQLLNAFKCNLKELTAKGV